MPKETIRIDGHALGPYRDIAGILGMTVSSYVERHLLLRIFFGPMPIPQV